MEIGIVTVVGGPKGNTCYDKVCLLALPPPSLCPAFVSEKSVDIESSGVPGVLALRGTHARVLPHTWRYHPHTCCLPPETF